MNMIEEAKKQIDALVRGAYAAAVGKGLLPAGAELKGTTEIPKDPGHGDYACSYAMSAAKAMHMAPRKIAETLAGEIDFTGSWFDSVEVAGAGFLDFRLGDAWYAQVLRTVEAEGQDYGSVDEGHGKKVMVEFVSANPTGTMTIGNARGGVLGDAMASILAKAGWQVWREFYVNDAGNQVELFARSVEARYIQLLKGEDAVEFPEDGYHGDDIREIAVDPVFTGALHSFAPAVQAAADVQYQGIFVLFEHFPRPVVKDAGPHSHIIGEPFGPGFPADREALRCPDPLGRRVLQNDVLLADFGLAV